MILLGKAANGVGAAGIVKIVAAEGIDTYFMNGMDRFPSLYKRFCKNYKQ